MSEITPEIVKKIAKLAHITITADEIPVYAQKIDSILAWVNQLNQVDVSDVAPSAGGIDMPLSLRADVVSDGGYPAEIVKNAPISDEHFFAVPKVVE